MNAVIGKNGKNREKQTRSRVVPAGTARADLAISVYFRKAQPAFLARVQTSFPKSKQLKKGRSWTEVVLKENADRRNIGRNLDFILKRLSELREDIPPGSTLVVAHFFDTAMSSVALDSAHLILMSRIGLNVEFVAYPCAEA